MKFTDICIITDKVKEIARFYEIIFEAKAEGDGIHSFIKAAGLGIAIYNKSNAETDMEFDLSDSGTGLITIGFNVDNVAVEYLRIKNLNVSNLTEPKLWPWGAKSFHFEDPDGNIIVIRSIS